MSTITKEQLRERARQKVKSLELAVTQTAFADSRAELEEELELARIALASLEAKPVSVNDDMAYAFHHAISDSSLGSDEVEEIKTGLRAAFANVTAPPAPISVPDAMEMDDDFDSAFEHGKAVGWNAYRAAMLQGAEPAKGWIPCSERMPEEIGRYWCYVEEQNCLGKSHYQWNCSWNGDRWWVESENGGRVTHWMPLPNQPKE
ncbi:DUF551 domain-containing protein [Enterobacter hormaechei]|nr:DUF551 domain-containing protein [Enterobacter hormaechei]